MQKSFKITKEFNKERLDVFLEKQLPEFSRSYIKKLIANELVLVNGKTVKAGFALREGDEVVGQIEHPKALEATPEDIQLDIVYEDEDFAVINKPQGMVVHPAAGNFQGTVVNAALYHIKNLSGINGVIRPGIVHRLDKDTSGLLIVAKNDVAHNSLSFQIASKQCKRFYMALLHGRVKEPTGIIKTYMGRDPKNRLKMAVTEEQKGKYAETHYKVVSQWDKYALVEFELKTGRTHQIRVHSQHMGNPVAGDKVYNHFPDKIKTEGQLLVAYKLVVTHPRTGKELTFKIDLPEYFTRVVNALK